VHRVLILLLVAAVPCAAQSSSNLPYDQVLAGYEANGVRRAAGVDIVVPATAFAAATPGAVMVGVGIGGRQSPVLLWE